MRRKVALYLFLLAVMAVSVSGCIVTPDGGVYIPPANGGYSGAPAVSLGFGGVFDDDHPNGFYCPECGQWHPISAFHNHYRHHRHNGRYYDYTRRGWYHEHEVRQHLRDAYNRRMAYIQERHNHNYGHDGNGHRDNSRRDYNGGYGQRDRYQGQDRNWRNPNYDWNHRGSDGRQPEFSRF